MFYFPPSTFWFRTRSNEKIGQHRSYWFRNYKLLRSLYHCWKQIWKATDITAEHLTLSCPAAILFDSDGTVDSFGYDARKEYFNLDDEDRLKYTYFEQIKMNLQHDEVILT